MALSASTLESMIIGELNAQGIVTDGEHAKAVAQVKDAGGNVAC